MLLQRQPNQNATQLGQALNVSVRTVQRYITMLDDIGIPVYAERGPYGGYSLARGCMDAIAFIVRTPYMASVHR